MANILDAIGSHNQEIEAAKQKLSGINQAVSDLGNALTDAVAGGTIVGTDRTPSTLAAEDQKLKAMQGEQAANQQRAQTVDFEATSNDLLAQIKEQSAVRDQKLKEIQDINSSYNPLEHLAGLVTIPFKAAQATVADKRATGAYEDLARINSLMQSSAKTSAEIQTRVTDETRASILEALANDQKAAAIQAKARALQTDAAGITQILGMSNQQLHNEIQGFNIQEAMDMRALRKAQIEQSMALQRAAKDDQRAKELSVDYINAALSGNGLAPIEPDKIPLIADQLNKPGPVGETLRALMQRGFISAQRSGGESVAQFTQGDTPVEAKAFRDMLGYEPATSTEADTLAIIDGLMTSHKTVTEAKTAGAKIEAANRAVLAKLQADEMNVSTANNSLAKPASWLTLKASAALKNNRLFQEIIGPQITDNIVENAIDPADLFKRVGTALKNKQGTIDEAVAVHQAFVNISIQMNNRASGLTKLTGLQQTKFVSMLPQPRPRNVMEKALSSDVGSALYPLPNFLAQVGRGVMSNTMVPVDQRDSVSLYNAYASFLSGELKHGE